MVDQDAMKSLLERKESVSNKLEILSYWFRFKAPEPVETYHEVTFNGKKSILSSSELSQLEEAVFRLGSSELNTIRECTKEEYEKWKEDFHG